MLKCIYLSGPVNKSLCDLDGAVFREHGKQRIIDYNITGKVFIFLLEFITKVTRCVEISVMKVTGRITNIDWDW